MPDDTVPKNLRGEYVTLVSSDGHRFIIHRKQAMVSGTIKNMMSGPGHFEENESSEFKFRDIESHILEKVCKYFQYKIRYTKTCTEIPDFPIAPENALQLLMAANFFDS